MANAWTQMERLILIKNLSVSSRTIFIERLWSFAITGTVQSPDLHQTDGIASYRDGRISIERATTLHDLPLTLATRGTLWIARSQSDGCKDSWKKSTIKARSNRNRGAIKPRSWLLHRRINAMIIRQRSFENQDHDRLTIVAQSWRECGSFEVKSWLIQRQSGSHDQCQGNRSYDTIKSLHDRINRPQFSSKISLIKHVFSLLVL